MLHKTTAFTHTMYFFKFRQIGFRQIWTEPAAWTRTKANEGDGGEEEGKGGSETKGTSFSSLQALHKVG